MTESEALSILATLVQNIDVSDEELTAFVTTLDANNDSRITFVELVLAARLYGSQVTLSEAVEFVNNNVLNTCQISVEEVVQAAQDVEKLPLE